MKRQFGKSLQHIAAIMLGVFLILSPAARAADNTGTGDVAGDGGALVDSNIFQLFSTGAALTLVKTAFLTSTGAQLSTGATLPQGTMVDFMIYVNNPGSVAVTDTSIQDVLDPLFVYQAGTIRVDNSVANCAAVACTPAEEAAIYASASGLAASTDAVDGPDPASFAGVTVDVGDQAVANGQVDAAANRVLAVVFTVQVQ
jgi:uncharacterized repeat protein (TIGR01451 family)